MKTAFGPVTIGSLLATIADRLAGKTAITEGEADYLNEMRRRRPQAPYFIGALCVGAFAANVSAS
jgi:hypothetical protein